MKSLESRIKAIELRNSRVEVDKAWETSLTRRILIIAITYFTMTLVMNSIGVDRPFINAIIPTLGFFLSTLSFGVVKNLWRKSRS